MVFYRGFLQLFQSVVRSFPSVCAHAVALVDRTGGTSDLEGGGAAWKQGQQRHAQVLCGNVSTGEQTQPRPLSEMMRLDSLHSVGINAAFNLGFIGRQKRRARGRRRQGQLGR